MCKIEHYKLVLHKLYIYLNDAITRYPYNLQGLYYALLLLQNIPELECDPKYYKNTIWNVVNINELNSMCGVVSHWTFELERLIISLEEDNIAC